MENTDMTTNTNAAAACAPGLTTIDADTAAGMVNDRLAAILPALRDAGFDIYLSTGLRGRRASYVHVGRDGWAGYLEASDLPWGSHGYRVSFPLVPSKTHGTGIGVWTDDADSDGVYTDPADAVNALELACAPTTAPAIWGTQLDNISVDGLLRRHGRPTHFLPAGSHNRED